MANTYLITGANRGIGLALAQAAAAQGHRVIGTARNPDAAADLRATADRIEQLDADSDDSCRALAIVLKNEPIDVLINNAGISPKGAGNFMAFDPEAYLQCLRTNSVGPLLVTRALLPNLENGTKKLIVQISSQMGSLGDVVRDGNTGGLAYRSSKSALNMASLLIANELRPKGIACVIMHPGWVRTDMGGPEAHLGPSESADAILSTIGGMTLADSGRYVRFDGGAIDW
jgi:NAD(P)-dependent dehydrogenase (short-subunit alcohol dehydrogenase family)